MCNRADGASILTCILSLFGLVMSKANAWAAEYMPLLTATSIVLSLIITAWFYRQKIKIARQGIDRPANKR